MVKMPLLAFKEREFLIISLQAGRTGNLSRTDLATIDMGPASISYGPSLGSCDSQPGSLRTSSLCTICLSKLLDPQIGSQLIIYRCHVVGFERVRFVNVGDWSGPPARVMYVPGWLPG